MDITMDVFGFTNSGSKVKIGEIAKRLYPIGGTVFYVNPNSTGASYTFFDSNGGLVQVDDYDLSSFANASYFIKNGTGDDRYYVYENITGKVAEKYWGYVNIITSATGTGIGDGKTNTSTVLAITDTSEYASGSIWEYIRNMRTNEVNGCDDWYVGSEGEYDLLRNSGTTGASWFSGGIWSSDEVQLTKSQRWYRSWSYFNRDAHFDLVPIRSF